MNIFQKVSAITHELTVVAKNLSVGQGKSSYKAVGEADVLAAVKPLEEKYGVYSYPMARNVIYSDLIETEKPGYNGAEPTKQYKFFMRVETTYRFVNIDEPTDCLDVMTYGDGVDTLDKAPGKAMTYADKYALLKAYKIITGDDPDQKHSDEVKVTRKAKTYEQPNVDVMTSRQFKELNDLLDKFTPQEQASWLKWAGVESVTMTMGEPIRVKLLAGLKKKLKQKEEIPFPDVEPKEKKDDDLSKFIPKNQLINDDEIPF